MKRLRRASGANPRSDASPSRAGGAESQGGPEPIRLQRALAAAGVAARRACEAMIEKGRVTVNGSVVRRLPAFVRPGVDRVAVDGRQVPIAFESRRLYVLFNKPERVMCTASDDGGRTTVMDLVKHPSGARLFPVGRLDFHTSGLVLLTNDGDLAHRLTHPSFGVERVHEATILGVLQPAQVAELQQSVREATRRSGPEFGFRRRGAQTEIVIRAVGVTNPEPRERSSRFKPRRAAGPENQLQSRASESAGPGLRTVLEVRTLGAQEVPLSQLLAIGGQRVRRVVRTGLGPLALTSLGPGEWRELTRDELRSVRALIKQSRMRPITNTPTLEFPASSQSGSVVPLAKQKTKILKTNPRPIRIMEGGHESARKTPRSMPQGSGVQNGPRSKKEERLTAQRTAPIVPPSTIIPIQGPLIRRARRPAP
ncbi:MAG: rRNA pseudouridine synthase [Phycisphaerae bacterium]|nr:rRNA pseudouridine synthase [Phycisphaerae bacterium]